MSKFAKFQRLFVTFLIAVGFFYGGYYYGQQGYIFEVRKNPPEITVKNRYPKDQTIEFERFWEVWDLVSENYLLRPVDPEKMVYGAISGMVSSLGDPYTSFMPPKVHETVVNSINGAYEGIGAELGLKEGVLIIVSPFDGSPSKEAGLLSGDKIVKIEGEITFGMSITDAVSKIRGDSGTVVNLTVQTNSDEPREVPIVRGKIKVPSVAWENKGEGTVYIRVSRFGEQTNKDWTETIQNINVQVEELDALIIDLRGNPGGYLQSAIHISGEFFRDKPVVYQESATGEQIVFDNDRIGLFVEVPAVFVLIDKGSASASEILAAALKYHNNAILIGETSFGKGTIQEPRDFSDGSGLHITVAKWLTPGKEWIHETGITPDVVVERTKEDVQAGIDAQLDKAVELANEI
ncbi:S41 family peptidase [Patescibacteria group bacterium]|nr:S41 family peptidase [Patescibacteria group bacterium]